MKTTIYILIVVVFGGFLFIPKPKYYPSEKEKIQRETIVFKENRLDHLIDKISYQLEKDSLQIKLIKNEQSQRN